MPTWLLYAIPAALVGYFLIKSSSSQSASSGAGAAAPAPSGPVPSYPGGLQLQLGNPIGVLEGLANASANPTSITLDGTNPTPPPIPAYSGVFTVYLPASSSWSNVPITYDAAVVSFVMPVIGNNPIQISLTGVPGTIDLYWTDGGGNMQTTEIVFQ